MGKGRFSLEQQLMGKRVLLEMDGIYKSMDVEEYVAGVLSGVIPPDYERETLQLQAVLVRTNVLREMQEKKTEDGADLSYHYMTMEERKQLWGQQHFLEYQRKFRQAVARTAGKVIVQGGNLITAYYHEVSVGKTASAKEILGEEISYLQSVDSSQDVEAKHYMEIISYTNAQLREKKAQYEKQNAEDRGTEPAKVEEQKLVCKVEESTENGFVKTFSFDGISMSGEDAKQLFELPSVNFYVEEMQDGVRMVCLGKGNCLGVSQYGANSMARNKKSMEEIINHYYHGVSLTEYSP